MSGFATRFLSTTPNSSSSSNKTKVGAVAHTVVSSMEALPFGEYPVEHLVGSVLLHTAAVASPALADLHRASLYNTLSRVEKEISRQVIRSRCLTRADLPAQSLKAFLLRLMICPLSGPLEAVYASLTPSELLLHDRDHLKRQFATITADKAVTEALNLCKLAAERVRDGAVASNMCATLQHGVGPHVQDGPMTAQHTASFDGRVYPACFRPSVNVLCAAERELPLVFTVDVQCCLVPEPAADIGAQMAKACKARLPPDQQRTLISAVTSQPQLIYLCGLNPAMLPQLVECNKEVAYACLSRLLSTPHRDEFLTVLCEMDVAEPSCDVLRRLISAGGVPSNFVHAFASHGVRFLDTTKNVVKSQQRVRIFALLCLSLVQTKALHVPEVLLELQHFCTSNAEVPEVAKLFSSVKKLLELASKTRTL